MIMVKYSAIIDIIDSYLEKTHDGTSMSKINSSLDNFAEKYGQIKDHEEISFYTDNGKEIMHLVGQEHGVDDKTLKPLTDKLEEENYTDVHVDHNHPTVWDTNVPTFLSENDMLTLMETNNDGDYIYRSISAESPNGSRMTIIRNDKFNNEDHTMFKEVIQKINRESLHYSIITYKDAHMKALQQLSKEYTGNNKKEYLKSKEFHKKADDLAIKKVGTLEDYLKNQGLYDELSSVNCKLRIKQPKWELLYGN